jgi:hypothetical protein
MATGLENIASSNSSIALHFHRHGNLFIELLPSREQFFGHVTLLLP